MLHEPRQPVQQLQAVEDYHDTAYCVYRAQELRADFVAESETASERPVNHEAEAQATPAMKAEDCPGGSVT